MQETKIGVEIKNEDGSLSITSGSHVIFESPDFAKLVGEVATVWAQAETLLSCYLAILLGTTPDDALNRVLTNAGKTRPAAKVIEETQKMAKASLAEGELANVQGLLERLDAVRDLRNTTQHAIWSRKGGDSVALYAVPASDYIELVTGSAHLAKQSGDVADAIAIGNKYVLKATDRFTLKDLGGLRDEIQSVSDGLSIAFFTHLDKTPGKTDSKHQPDGSCDKL